MHTRAGGICTIVLGCWLSIAATGAAAWNATGHMITAKIAEDRLEPDVRAEVNRLIGVLSGFEPEFSNLVPAATWMDMIKQFDRGLLAFNPWHFYDQPYNPQGLPGVVAPPEQNVVWAIGQASATVGSPQATDFEKALMLRMLIHFVGDVHQPLHATNRISISNPDGDFGGNFFDLSGAETSNLHQFWDDTAGIFPKIDPAKDWRPIAGFAKKIENAISASDQPPLLPQGSMSLEAWAQSNAQAWAIESYQYGVNAAYAGIKPNTSPSAAYTARAREIIRERLAYGGYRLAAVLNTAIMSGMAESKQGD
ncbi:MAG: S1/P1 nuclease [Halioglobus sp.]